MSVADVCELGSILKCDADEKLAMEKKVCDLQKKCKIVEKNAARETDEGSKIEREQQRLCVQVQDGAAERFELLSLKLSEIKTESSCDVESNDYYARLFRYIATRTALQDDISLIARQSACLQDKVRLREVHRADKNTAQKLIDVRIAVNEKENTVHTLQNYDSSSLEHSVADKQKHLADLSNETFELLRPDLEEKRKEQEDNIAALDAKAATERNDAANALESARSTTAAISARLKQREDTFAAIRNDLIAATADCESSAGALTCAQQHHDTLSGKSVQLKDAETRAENALKDATRKLGDANDLEKARRAEEKFLTWQLSQVQPGETDDEEHRRRSADEAAALAAALDAQHATMGDVERDITALTAQPDTNAPQDLRDIAEERSRLEERIEKARADTTEHLREKDELEASSANRSRLSSEATKEQNDLAAANDRLLLDVRGLEDRVQAIVDQIEAAVPASVDESPQLDEKIKDLERQHTQVNASLHKAEERHAKDETESSRKLLELDVARARRYIADSYAERQKELHALDRSVAAADREYQALAKDGEQTLKGAQKKLKEVMDRIEARHRQSAAQIAAVEKEIESLGGADELAALIERFGEEKLFTSAASTQLPSHAGTVNRGTPPDDSWATSAPAQFGSNFASGLEDESQALLEAQRLHDLELATRKPTVTEVAKGRGRGRQRS